MELAELAAVIAGADARARPCPGPRSVTALMPAFMAAATASLVSPSMTISSTALMSGPSSLLTTPRSVGAKASLVEAIMPLYLPPIFEPERTMPPGKRHDRAGDLLDRRDGGLGGGQRLGAAVGEQQKVAAADGLLGHAGRRLAEELAVHDRNAPEMPAAELLGDLPAVAEIAQRRAELELRRLRRGRRSRRCRARSARIGRRRFCSCFCSSSVLTAKIITRQPGRPSGVADGGSSTSIAASQPQPMTEVAKPVIVIAACRAHLRFGAGDDDRGRAHAEGFGKGIVDRRRR